MKILILFICFFICYFLNSLIFYCIGRLTLKRFPRFGSRMWDISGIRLAQLKSYCTSDCSSCRNYNCKNLKIKDGSI